MITGWLNTARMHLISDQRNQNYEAGLNCLQKAAGNTKKKVWPKHYR